MLNALGKLFRPPQLKVDDELLGVESPVETGPVLPEVLLLAEPVLISEGPSAVDGWSLPDEFPRPSEPVASWLDDVGVVPFARLPASAPSRAAPRREPSVPEAMMTLDSHDLLEAIPEAAQLPTLAQELHVPLPAPIPQAAAPIAQPVEVPAPIPQQLYAPTPIPEELYLQEPMAQEPMAPSLDVPSLDSVTVPEPPVDPWLADVDVPQLTTATGRGWLPIVAGGIAIVCAVIGIFVAG
jgi:hypothetical protein